MSQNIVAENSPIKERDTRKLLSDTKFFEGYSRYDETLGRYETWPEAVGRVMNMHRKYFAKTIEKNPILATHIDNVEKAYADRKLLGAQRSLQFGGEQILKHHMRLYNCVSSHVDRPAFFGEYFYILLCGAGAGFSVQKHHIAKLPMIRPRTKQPKTHTIDDSIEGWATALDVLLSSYFMGGGKHPEYEGRRVFFEYHKIRKKDSLISGGFKAPGPEPLKKALSLIEIIMTERAEEGVLRPIDAYDILMHAADAVLSGGVRRAATICLFSKDDTEMLQAKTGNWFIDNKQRARSNNSVVLLRNEVTMEEFVNIMKHVKEYGEPGFVFVSSLEHCFNPCVEIGMYPKTESGISGWQGCVSENTKLITREGITNIADSVGKEIEIWNGTKWSKVTPRITGENRSFFKVIFGDGSELEATENHKFLAKNRFEKTYKEYTTLEIQKYLNEDKYVLSTPRYEIIRDENGKAFVPNAYDYGFILGDGTVRDHRKSATAIIYEDYFDCNFPITGVLQSENTDTYNNKKVRTYYWNKNSLDLNIAYELKYSDELPDFLFTWDRISLMNFFAGWIDTDGTVLDKGGCRIYGKEGHIKTGQLLLSSLGIKSSVNLMSSKGEKTNKGIRNRDVWYLQITETKDLFSHKKKIISGKLTKKGKEQTIKEIIPMNTVGTSYCFDEPETHSGVFNNVLTKQCNLVEGNGSLCKTKEDFYELCRNASILATLQAAYTDFKFVTSETKEIFEREALLGVSLTGWMNSPDVLFDKTVLKKGAEIVKKTNREIAQLLGIRPAARTTCVKPAGNASVLLGTASGIHPEHSKKYIRNIQINKSQEVSDIIKKTNPYMVEESVWSSLKTDNIISFPVIAPENSIFKNDLNGVEFLEHVKLVQNSWVEYGTDESLCVDPTVRHNVSNTVTVKANEWDDVTQYLYDNRKYFTGVSLIGETGDKDYFQAPNIEVLSPKEMVEKYGEASLFASGLIVDASTGFDNLWEAITIAQQDNDDSSQERKDIRADWIRRFRKFADNYFGGNLVITGYCLKDVYILYKWVKIQNNFTDIVMEENLQKLKEISIDTMGAAACAAGACEI
jgi:hypothetical protein